MSRGPAPKPTAIRVAEGTFRADRHGDTVNAPPGVPAPPEWLSVDELEVWNHVVASLLEVEGLLARVDGEAIARYASDWCDWLRHKLMADEQSIAYSDSGTPFQHPAVGIRNRAHDRLRKFEEKFAMTPADRARIHLNVETPSEAAEKFLA